MSKEVKRIILLNPGPATTTDTVKHAQVLSDVCHREESFLDVYKSLNEDLKKGANLGDDFETVIFTGSGTIVMDAVLSSFVPKDGKVLIINNGLYGKRAVEVCEYYQIEHVDLKYPTNQIPNLGDIEEALKKNDDITMVYVTHHETSTGILNPIHEIGKLAKQYNKLYVVDSISSYLMIPIDVKKDNIDVLMSSSQKGTSSMPGVGYVIAKKSVILNSKDYPKRSYYTNIYRHYNFFDQNGESEFTPAVQTIYALRQSLDEILEEGVENKFKRHQKAFEVLDKGIRELGFKYYVDEKYQSKLLIAPLFPNDPNWSFDKLIKLVRDEGFVIYPGKIKDVDAFRLSVFGAITYKDMENFLEVLKKALIQMNVQVPVKY